MSYAKLSFTLGALSSMSVVYKTIEGSNVLPLAHFELFRFIQSPKKLNVEKSIGMSFFNHAPGPDLACKDLAEHS